MVQVKVEEGILEGELLDNEYGKPYYSFKGIPYAEPPIGDLRFKAPKPIKPWDGVRPAKDFGSVYYSREYFEGIPPPSGCEDCLYINVYSPDLKPKKPFPVMFWIHGGGYMWGSGNDNMYGPEFLVRQDVILVTFNYRLGILGFLSLDTEDVPGNAGMKDQVLALKWVKKNISQFGGDPNNITIFGESAGGTSVSFHLVSPMSKGLFKRAIVQSGSATCSGATSWFHREIAEAFARQLGCYSNDDKELFEFYKNQPYEKFIDLDIHVTVQAKKIYGELSMAVVSEKYFGQERFFEGDAFDKLRNNIHEGVEVIIGYTEHDGIIGINFNAFYGQLDSFLNFVNESLEFFLPKQITIECPLKQQLEIAKRIKKFYIKDGKVSRNNIDELINFITMNFFAVDVIRQTKFLSRRNKTYSYKFTPKTERNQMARVFGMEELFKDKFVVCHADDLAYLFPVKLLNQMVDKNSETFKIIDNVTKLWTNFAKFGNPTPDESLGAKWVPYTMEGQDYLDIGNKLVPRNSPAKKDMEFWDDLYAKYLPRCNVNVILHKKKHQKNKKRFVCSRNLFEIAQKRQIYTLLCYRQVP